MFYKNTLRLFWWNERKIQGKSKENYGDLLGKYLVEKISGKKVIFAFPKKFSFLDYFMPIYVTAGSILAHVNYKCIVWGSGIIAADCEIANANFLAVRGPQSQKHLINQGFEVPSVYGDPGLLLSKYYNPDIKKKYRFGIVPHYNDYKKIKDWYENIEDVLLIDLMTNDIEATTDTFLQCEHIISSSLHGVIISHAFGIPAIWQQFTNKVFGDAIKYRDYFESVEIEPYLFPIKETPYLVNEMEALFSEDEQVLPKSGVVERLQRELLNVCPFKP
jgi:pyruvyltransferase